MTEHRSSTPAPHQRGALARCLADLADTADDAPGVDAQLITAALLTADLVAAADYASVTVLRDGGYTTVAASSQLARAVDRAQYDSASGPCLDSVATGAPVAVPDMSTAIRWPGFRDEAWRLGLRASLSIPLFAGSGTTIAALNLYGRDHVTMTPLSEAVLTVFDIGPGDGEQAAIRSATLDDGSRDLLAGLAEAHAVRAIIQRAIGLLIGRVSCTAEQGYRTLRGCAADAGTTLSHVATDLLTEPT
ncbi:GAF and ANTAR domain-containing protein [Paractinoplanes maris]|uniref:GAF and ANTAR domain-containing protein n=1 Tax=Paractinoplanes maris TaxID=1734446 RepID=UPI00201FEED2|nr:GAF and ANTAR domain-containing protein [Actinoplanes maris]